LYEVIKKKFVRLIKENGLEGEEVIIRAAALSGVKSDPRWLYGAHSRGKMPLKWTL